MTIKRLLVVDSSVEDQVLSVMQSEGTPFFSHVEEVDVPTVAVFAPSVSLVGTTVFTGAVQTIVPGFVPFPALLARAWVEVSWFLDWHNSAGFDRAPMAGVLSLTINGGLPLNLGQEQWHPTGPGIVGGDCRGGSMVLQLEPGDVVAMQVTGNNNAPYAPNAGQIVAGPSANDAMSKLTLKVLGYV